MARMALGIWDEKRHWNQGQRTQKTLIHIPLFPPFPFPPSQEVMFPGIVVRLPILTNDTLAASFQVDQSPFKSLGEGRELVGPGWLFLFYGWKQQGPGLRNRFMSRTRDCWAACQGNVASWWLSYLFELPRPFPAWASRYQHSLSPSKCPVLLLPFCAFVLGL